MSCTILLVQLQHLDHPSLLLPWVGRQLHSLAYLHNAAILQQSKAWSQCV